MKLLFIPSRAKVQLSLQSLQNSNLPLKLGLVSTVQYNFYLNQIKAQLEKQGKQAYIGKAKNMEPGQILGCNTEAASSIQDKVDAFLYLGSGKFHPIAIAMATGKPIFILNPETQQLSRLDEKDIARAKAMKKTREIKYLSADSFGILVSTKPGQNKLKQAMALKEKLEKKGKKACIFLSDTFDINQLENFPSIECWVNTMCPGLSREQPFVWIGDIKV
jgi:2-(3-amino-3-carboxypropyl)histidine synthase